MKHYLIPESGHFYKANLHTHTTCSDGCKTPEEIKEIYKAHGYSVIAYTDHDVMIDHSDLNDEDFLTITSHEVETNGPAMFGDFGESPCYHLNFYSPIPDQTDYACPNPGYTWGNARAIADTQPHYKGDYRRIYSVEGQNHMIAEARAKGYLVSYNHPNWSKQSYPDYIGLEGFTALEVYNTGCAVGGWTLDESDHVLDEFLMAGKRVYPVATDDNHGEHDMCGGWVRFKAESLTYENIFNAYAKGDFYASWGPEIHALYLEDGVLKMDFPADSHVCRVAVHSASRWAAARYGEDMTHTEVDMKGFFGDMERLRYPDDRGYFRVVVFDDKGRRAVTRGYFLDELK